MDYIISASTDIGLVKQTNQDSLVMKRASTPFGEVVFAALCDGMGGLAKGEVASASLIMALSDWFTQQFPHFAGQQPEDYQIRSQWEKIVREQNEKIKNYGKLHQAEMGTTVVILLLTPKRYYIMNIGDSRVYEIQDQVIQLTEDQTIVAKEVREGILTPEQAYSDPRRSVLLQCVGVNDHIYPEMYFGETKNQSVYLLCSDGFIHEISNEEIYQYLQPGILGSKDAIKNHTDSLIELNKQRKEKDNISVAVIKTC